MRNKRYFFLYQNTTELNLIKFIIKLLPSNGIEINLFCVDTYRLNLKSISDLSINKIIIDEIKYSKYFIKELKKVTRLKRKISSLNIDRFDTFITQPLYSLNNFILYKIFNQKQSRIISYALNSIEFKNNKLLKIKYLMSFKHSIYTFFYSRKLIYFYNLKNSVHNYVFTKTF